ncbi:TolC family protein [Pedobacter caeni]|uniref:Outer membrane protein TolC n=1 Tax=Pedobacter caeni TaxID=288992 RepID=A0A1M4ZYN6_9SPHI|nr:TolC family protein [Pedobacter caeni]SHF23091.1 Outer membrane protein TolC [Pedobacter caeni]
MKQETTKYLLIFTLVNILLLSSIYGQERRLTINEAMELAVANSNRLKIDQSRIELAVNQYNQAKDRSLPTGRLSTGFSHAEIPANHIIMGDLDWTPGKRGEIYTGGISMDKSIFDGNQLKYARKTTQLLTDIVKLDAKKNKDQVLYMAIEMYFDLYKITQRQKVTMQNINALDSIIVQSEQFYRHGIVTKNDVLRFKLQKSEVELTASDLEMNRKIINYNMTVLLGFPEDLFLQPDAIQITDHQLAPLHQYIEEAFVKRPELQQTIHQIEIDKTAFSSVRANLLPKLSASLAIDYFHAGADFIPASGSFLAQFSAGAALSWNFSNLWFNKNKTAEVRIQQHQTFIRQNELADRIRKEVNQSYQNYSQVLNKIRLLQTAMEQSTENNKMQADKYRNNIASVIDRIDADTKLFQTLTKVEIARADAELAWFRLLLDTGNLSKSN